MEGDRDLEGAFRDLGKVGTKSVMRTVLRKTAKPTLLEARRLAPRSGDGKGIPLADTLKMATRLKRKLERRRDKSSLTTMFVGPTDPKAHLVEFGHVKKGGRGRIAVVGHVAGRPFMRPAYEATKDKSEETLKDEIWKAVVNLTKRWARNAAKGKLSAGATRHFLNRGEL